MSPKQLVPVSSFKGRVLVELQEQEPPTWAIADGSHEKPKCYDCLVDGKKIGRIYKVVHESWRKVGRIRTSLIGYERGWTYEFKHRTPYGGFCVRTRQAAIERLVEDWKRDQEKALVEEF